MGKDKTQSFALTSDKRLRVYMNLVTQLQSLIWLIILLLKFPLFMLLYLFIKSALEYKIVKNID